MDSLAMAECMHMTFAQGYYTIESKYTGRKWNHGCPAQDQLNTSESTALYVKAKNYSLNVLGDRGIEPGPFAQAAIRLTTGPSRPEVWGERNDLSGGDKEDITSLGFWLERVRNGWKGEVKEVTTSWMVHRMTSSLQAFLDKTIDAGDHKQCKMCNQSS